MCLFDHKEDNMAVSLFVGVMGGAILGFATQNKRHTIFASVHEKHPILYILAGLILVLGLIFVPIAALSNVIQIDPTPFYWGGCVACSFFFGYFMAHYSILQDTLENAV